MIAETVILKLTWEEYKILTTLVKETKDDIEKWDKGTVINKKYKDLYSKLYTQRTIEKYINCKG